jgi:hypothetical protein
VASLMSCTEGDVQARFDEIAPSADSVRIRFSCGAVDSIALTDPSGAPAWAVTRRRNSPISWVVPPNVTINSIVGKTAADTLPLDPDGPQGGAPGAPFKSKVKGNAREKTYHYLIDATCRPASGPPDRRMVIDPEMIVR